MSKNFNQMMNEPVDSELLAEDQEEVKIGVVSECKHLYVREAASKDAEPVGVLHQGAEVMIDDSESVKDFYKVYTEEGVEGFCMKQFITIK